MSDKNRVYIFDTTMRDGEQSPGASMSLEEKIQISRIFDELGILLLFNVQPKRSLCKRFLVLITKN